MTRKKADLDGFAYDGEVGRWWYDRSLDRAHALAYRKIADFIRASYPNPPKLVVDYACGPGNLLSLLSVRFPQSQLVGLDGSSFMLGLARKRFSSIPSRCAERISLIETALPNLDLMRGKADLAVFCFPNMVPAPSEESTDHGSFLNKTEQAIARQLSCSAEYSEAQASLEYGRRISYNLRRLLVKGGICIRVEYASMHRHELAPAELTYVAFEEGSLDQRVDGKRARQWFRLRASAYCRSRVLSDVYEQTGDERDRRGGYLITVLEAV